MFMFATIRPMTATPTTELRLAVTRYNALSRPERRRSKVAWGEAAARLTNALSLAISAGLIVEGTGQHHQLADRCRDAWIRSGASAPRMLVLLNTGTGPLGLSRPAECAPIVCGYVVIDHGAVLPPVTGPGVGRPFAIPTPSCIAQEWDDGDRSGDDCEEL